MNNKTNNSIPIPFVMLAAYIIVIVAAVAYSVTTLEIPVVGACVFVILEALLAALMRRVKTPVQVVVIAAQIIAGVYYKKVIFMIAMAVVYVAALILLSSWTRDYD